MLTGSAVDLYTTLLGWHLYNSIWSLLSATGIALIPFVVMVLKTLLEAQEKEGISAKQIVRTLEVRLYLMLAVLFFGVQPVLNIYTQNTTYKTLECKPQGFNGQSFGLQHTSSTANFGSTGTSFDQQANVFKGMIDGGVAQAPFWWFFMAPLNQAVTYALKYELPCKPDVREMISDLSTLNVTDPQLQAETAQFYNECYLPASNKFMRENPTIPGSIPNPAQDVAWMGSEFFINQAGYYDQLRPMTKPVAAITYCGICGDPVKGPDLVGMSQGGGAGPGWPTCDEWWKGRSVNTGGSDGLRKRLLVDLNNSNGQGLSPDQRTNFQVVTGNWYGSGTEQENALLKSVVGSEQKRAALPLSQDLMPERSSNWVDRFLGRMNAEWKNDATKVGVAWSFLPAAAKANAMKSAAPIVQALVLMMLTLLLPLLMMIGMYDIGKLVQLTLVHFSIVFWSFLFALAAWLDNFLLSGIMSAGNPDPLNSALNTDSTTKLIIGWITMFLYVALPLVFTSMMGLVGKGIAIGLGDVFTQSTAGLEKTASGVVSSAQSGAVGVLKRGAGKKQ